MKYQLFSLGVALYLYFYLKNKAKLENKYITRKSFSCTIDSTTYLSQKPLLSKKKFDITENILPNGPVYRDCNHYIFVYIHNGYDISNQHKKLI